MSQSRIRRLVGFRHGAHWLLTLALLAALLGPLLALPAPAAAASSTELRSPHPRPTMHPGRMIHSFWLTAEVEEVSEDSVKLLLEGRGHDHPMLRQFEWAVTLAVDEDSILLDGDFNQLSPSMLEVGTPVVFVPRMVWGTLGVRLLYTGSAQDLSDATYIGRATMVDDNTLTIERWRGDVTIVVDDATIWYDDGKRGRPDEFYDDTLVRLIGVEENAADAADATDVDEADGADETDGDVDSSAAADDDAAAEVHDGETVVRAILITPGKRGF